MKFIFINIFVFFLVVFLPSYVFSQDVFCHIDVISGAPVWFNFNKSEDFTLGKTIQYNTVLKISYSKKPDKIIFYTRAASSTFQGPSTTLDCDNFSVKIDDFRYVGRSSGQIFGFQAEDFRVLSLSNTNIGRAWIVTGNLQEDNPVFYVYLKFSCSPKHAEAFSNLIADSYTNLCYFSIQTWYVDATEKWPY